MANGSGLSCLLLPAEPTAQQSCQPSAVAEFAVVRRFHTHPIPMYRVIHDFGVDTPVGRVGVMEGQYQLSATTNFPPEWSLYRGNRSLHIDTAYCLVFVLFCICLPFTIFSLTRWRRFTPNDAQGTKSQ